MNKLSDWARIIEANAKRARGENTNQMVCNDCGHIFLVDKAVWAEVPGGGTIAVCPECKSSFLSDHWRAV